MVDLYFRDFTAGRGRRTCGAYEHCAMTLEGSTAAAMQTFLDDNPGG
ncbi:MAG: hypothetical protein IPG64_11180 [Haliea sp.]|nr:hypothetical protein [Haliea sp.]